MGVATYLSSLFQSCNKGGRMTCHVSRALDVLFLLKIVHQPIVEGMRGFGCASKFEKIVTWPYTPTFVIEREGWGPGEFFQFMDRPSRQSGEECEF